MQISLNVCSAGCVYRVVRLAKRMQVFVKRPVVKQHQRMMVIWGYILKSLNVVESFWTSLQNWYSLIFTFIYLFLSSCSWLSNDVRHKCTFVSAGDTQTLFGTGWPYDTVAGVWSHDMVAGFGLFTIKRVEHLLGLPVL